MTSIVEVCEFLQSVGGPYEVITPEICENVAYSLASDQYVYEKGLYFAGYWRVNYDDIEALLEGKRPEDITSGPICYVAEAASVDGAVRMMRDLKSRNKDAEAAMFHRGRRLMKFSLQKGDTP